MTATTPMMHDARIVCEQAMVEYAKFLMNVCYLLNVGAIAGVLTFMQNADDNSIMYTQAKTLAGHLHYILGFYLAGILAAVVASATAYHSRLLYLRYWNSLTLNKPPLPKNISSDTWYARAASARGVFFWLCVLSLTCFTLGSGCTAVIFFV